MMNEITVPTNSPGSDPDGPESPEVSTLGTLVGVFTKPKATFQALSARPRVLAPILVLLVSQLVFGLVLAHSGILRNDTVAKLEAKNAPPEQIEAVSKVMEGPTKYAFVIGGPVVLLFSLLVTAGLLYFIANLMLGARLRFIHYLCIAAYGGVVGIVDQMTRMGNAGRQSRSRRFHGRGIEPPHARGGHGHRSASPLGHRDRGPGRFGDGAEELWLRRPRGPARLSPSRLSFGVSAVNGPCFGNSFPARDVGVELRTDQGRCSDDRRA
jgi:hypothetical protein